MDHLVQSSESNAKTCLNCGTELKGRFCYACGQKDLPQRQTLGELLTNFVGSFTSFESKFFKTLKYLLFYPGFLTSEYNSGRRERYYHPARAYVFISFVFFLLFFSTRSQSADDAGSVVKNSRGGSESWKIALDSIEFETRKQYDSAQQALPEKDRDNVIMRFLRLRNIELNEKYNGRADQFGHDVIKASLDNFPKVFFYLLPIFALLLKLLYVRRDFYYAEHLVFSVNYYNFFYMAASILILVGFIPLLSWVKIVMYLWMIVYFILAMKRIYKQSWMKTLVKFFLFGFLFALLFVTGLVLDFLLVTLFVV